jgi:nucleoside 2-deoxyribosyltransferase
MSIHKSRKRIYLAGPLGFSEAGRLFQRVLTERLSKRYKIIDPFKLTKKSKIEAILKLPTLDEQRDAWRQLNPQIGKGNQEAIDSCDAVLANLDGQDVDSGTAAEIGYAFAKGKPIVGYRGDLRLSSDNVGLTVNLQVEFFIRESGGEIVMLASDIPVALSRLLKKKRTSSKKRMGGAR